MTRRINNKKIIKVDELVAEKGVMPSSSRSGFLNLSLWRKNAT